MVIPAKEVAAASTADILENRPSRKPNPPAPPTKPEDPAENAPPEATEAALAGASAPSPARLRPAPRKPKTDRRGGHPQNRQTTPCRPLDFLQYPDTAIKPTESREELMANARLMQQTLAQFDIEVALGDITKGPTITRYELHPARVSSWKGSPA